jgi:hypothetical protein
VKVDLEFRAAQRRKEQAKLIGPAVSENDASELHRRIVGLDRDGALRASLVVGSEIIAQSLPAATRRVTDWSGTIGPT